jgi:hypothetical protein
VCVKECPTELFVFMLNYNDPDWQNRMICKYGVSAANELVAEQLINDNECARYYLRSRAGESAVTTFSVRIFHKLW